MLSLFSGIGGLDLGLEAAGFNIGASVELDGTARVSLARNRGGWEQLPVHDVAELASMEPALIHELCGEVDLIAGAPPCQPFSAAGQWTSGGRNGLDDSRGMLVFDVLRLVRVLVPKVVVLENVQGFVQGRNSVVPLLCGALEELEKSMGIRYELVYRLLDSHEFGVPQRRRRAIITMSRVGELSWPSPMPESRRPTAWDAIGGCTIDPKGLEVQGKWADLLPSIPEGQNYQWHTSRGGGLPLFGYRTRYWSFLLKLSKTKPAWTLAAQPGPSTGPFHWDSRMLAVEEMLRLQSFPIGWVVDGNRREQVRQIGNATPPALAEAVGRSIIEALGASPPKRSRLRVKRRQSPPPEKKPAAVPAVFRELETDHEDHPGTGLGPAPRVSVI